MRIIGLLASSASGKAGGIVAYSSSTGSHLRARPSKVITRSTMASSRRNAFKGIMASWRSLSTGQQAAWNALAAGKESGCNLYTRACLNLYNIGATQPPTAPQLAPAFPAIAAFTVTPLYAAGSPLPMLGGFNVNLTLSAATAFIARLRATPAYSYTRAFIRRGELRTLATFTPSDQQQFQPLAAWNSIYGTYPPSGTITFALDLTDPVSGARSPAVRTRCSYTGTSGGGAQTGTIGLIMPSGLVVEAPLQSIYVGPTLIAVP